MGLFVWCCVLLFSVCVRDHNYGAVLAVGDAVQQLPVLGDWWVFGPFPVGKTEIDGDPVARVGGVMALWPPNSSFTLHSELVTGAEAKWNKMKNTIRGVSVEFSNVNWNNIVQSLNSMQAMEFQAWAVSEVKIARPMCVVVQCNGLHTITLGHTTLHADIYHTSMIMSVVCLEKGVVQLSSRIRGRASTAFKCQFSNIGTNALVVHNSGRESVVTSDIVEGILVASPISVTVTNVISTRVKGVALYSRDGSVQLTSEAIDLLPGQTAPIKGFLAVPPLKNLEKESKDRCFRLNLEIRSQDPEHSSKFEVWLRCRTAQQSFEFSFDDRDGTVVIAAAIRPHSPCKGHGCVVLMSLSGVGATASSNADAHKYMTKTQLRQDKAEYTFGGKRMWVLSPQRGGAHNWEGTGYQTSVHSLQALREMSRRMFGGAYQAHDTLRIYLGHSRGGHGSMMLSTHSPDHTLATLALSGWLCREEYGDANTLFRHDTQLSYSEVMLRSIFAATIEEHNIGLSLSNVVGIPHIVRTGSNDNSVPPYYSRKLARLLQEAGVEVTFRELAGKEHWWWDTVTPNDGGVLFDSEIRDFLDSRIQNMVEDATATLPAKFTVTSLNPSTFDGRGSIAIDQLYRGVGSRGFVHVTWDRNTRTCVLETSNVRRIRLIPQPQFEKIRAAVNEDGSSISVADASMTHTCSEGMVLEGTEFTSDQISHVIKNGLTIVRHVVLSATNIGDQSKTKITWEIDERPNYMKYERGPSNCGPARHVFFDPSLIAMPSSSATTSVAQQIALFVASSHFIAVGTLLRVVDESSLFINDAFMTYNHVIVGDIAFQRRVLEALPPQPASVPVVFGEHSITLGPCIFQKPRIGIAFVRPRWHNNTAKLDLIVTGTGKCGTDKKHVMCVVILISQQK
eukprot:c12528_g1_i1.p1 GENE.c12528_g1_i1~~c12528_g1_i1.p1  ORF type:complete len:916 (-),score=213.85 c12528_g1_i1:50-2758(-)